MQTKLTLAAAADASQHLTAFDPMTIINIIAAAFPVIKQLMSLCNPNPTPPSTRDFVQRHWVGRHNRYLPPFLHRVSDAMETKAQGTSMAGADSMYFDQLAISTLDSIRFGSDTDIQEQLDAAV